MQSIIIINKTKLAFTLFAGLLIVSSCNHKEVSDDFTKLKTFESDLAQLGVENPEMYSLPKLDVKLIKGYVVAITITGRGMNQLPKSIYGFRSLTELTFEETAFSSLPDLKPLVNLDKLTIEYNLFQGPVHLRNLPSSLNCLILNRDAITEVIVDDSIPNLSLLSLTQNKMRSRINSTFCKLPKLTFLDLSSGCCTTDKEAEVLEKTAQEVLCKKDVGVQAKGNFID
jgi:Leucine-rich repeat (LRR) protein